MQRRNLTEFIHSSSREVDRLRRRNLRKRIVAWAVAFFLVSFVLFAVGNTLYRRWVNRDWVIDPLAPRVPVGGASELARVIWLWAAAITAWHGLNQLDGRR